MAGGKKVADLVCDCVLCGWQLVPSDDLHFLCSCVGAVPAFSVAELALLRDDAATSPPSADGALVTSHFVCTLTSLRACTVGSTPCVECTLPDSVPTAPVLQHLFLCAPSVALGREYEAALRACISALGRWLQPSCSLRPETAGMNAHPPPSPPLLLLPGGGATELRLARWLASTHMITEMLPSPQIAPPAVWEQVCHALSRAFLAIPRMLIDNALAMSPSAVERPRGSGSPLLMLLVAAASGREALGLVDLASATRPPTSPPTLRPLPADGQYDSDPEALYTIDQSSFVIGQPLRWGIAEPFSLKVALFKEIVQAARTCLGMEGMVASL